MNQNPSLLHLHGLSNPTSSSPTSAGKTAEHYSLSSLILSSGHQQPAENEPVPANQKHFAFEQLLRNFGTPLSTSQRQSLAIRSHMTPHNPSKMNLSNPSEITEYSERAEVGHVALD